MPRWSKEELSAYENRVKTSRPGARAFDEKQQDADTGKVDNKTRISNLDRSVHPQFRVAITLLVSDRRRRDADGGIATILDALVKSIRRLGILDSVGVLGGKIRAKR